MKVVNFEEFKNTVGSSRIVIGIYDKVAETLIVDNSLMICPNLSTLIRALNQSKLPDSYEDCYVVCYNTFSKNYDSVSALNLACPVPEFITKNDVEETK